MMHAYSKNAAPGKPVPTDAVTEVQGMVRRVVTDNLDMGTGGAIANAAGVFFMSAQRTRGYYHGEAREVCGTELADAIVGFRAYLIQRRADLAWEDSQVVRSLEEHTTPG